MSDSIMYSPFTCQLVCRNVSHQQRRVSLSQTHIHECGHRADCLYCTCTSGQTFLCQLILLSFVQCSGFFAPEMIITGRYDGDKVGTCYVTYLSYLTVLSYPILCSYLSVETWPDRSILNTASHSCWLACFMIFYFVSFESSVLFCVCSVSSIGIYTFTALYC